MSYKPNLIKEELIRKHGVTVGLPLFDSARNRINIPDWIWDGSGIKSEVYEQMKKHFAKSKVIYLQTVIKLGGKATDNEVEANSPLRINIINARRKDLQKEGIMSSFDGSKKIGPSGAPNTIWFLNFKKFQEILYQQ